MNLSIFEESCYHAQNVVKEAFFDPKSPSIGCLDFSEIIPDDRNEKVC